MDQQWRTGPEVSEVFNNFLHGPKYAHLLICVACSDTQTHTAHIPTANKRDSSKKQFNSTEFHMHYFVIRYAVAENNTLDGVLDLATVLSSVVQLSGWAYRMLSKLMRN